MSIACPPLTKSSCAAASLIPHATLLSVAGRQLRPSREPGEGGGQDEGHEQQTNPIPERVALKAGPAPVEHVAAEDDDHHHRCDGCSCDSPTALKAFVGREPEGEGRDDDRERKQFQPSPERGALEPGPRPVE